MKPTSHLPPVWIEIMTIGTDAYFQKEMVITRVVSEKDSSRESIKIQAELKEAGFGNLIHFSRKVVKTPKGGFNKSSVIDSTRKLVAIHFHYYEERSGIKLPQEFFKLSRIKDIDETIFTNIQVIRKHPRWFYTGYFIKEYFDLERISEITRKHFHK